MNGNEMAGLAPLLLVVIAGALYLVPTMVAHNRKATIRGTATVINVFLGWTVIGWVVALAMAFGPTEPRIMPLGYPGEQEARRRVREGEAERLRRKAAAS